MKKPKPKIRIDLQVSVEGETINFSVDVPKGTTTTRKMLPVFRSACESIVRSAVKQAELAGQEVTCKPGCAACCRHMVPISTTEAAMIRELIAEMPPERQQATRERFAQAVRIMESAELVEDFNFDLPPTGPDYRELGLKYLSLGIECPFLVDEACSIYAERPLVCREYLAVSPPENCARTNDRGVEIVPIALSASKAVSTLGTKGNSPTWLPLTLTFERPEAELQKDLGTTIAVQFFNNLTHKDVTTASRPNQTISPTRS